MRAIPALLLMLAAAPAAAQSDPTVSLGPASAENGRYTMTPAADGFLRLDTRTGAVSLCKIVGANAQCRAAADDRTALTDEIERLSKRNAELETRTGGRDTARRATEDGEAKRAIDMAEQFMRRMMRIMREESKNPT